MIRAREDRWFDRYRQSGDPRHLARVFDRTAPELWKVASHLCRDRHATEDAVQGTFLVAIEARHDWDGKRPLLPWLLGLLVNRVRDGRRQQRLPDRERVTQPATERDPAELATQDELGGALRKALQGVPEPYRDTLERHLVRGHATPEIAVATGVPAGTVRMRLHRGLEQLRRRLPAGFTGGAAIGALTRESLAAMRRGVLASVPGGSGVAAVGAVSAGHFLLGWLGGILMNKALMTVVVASFVLAGSWLVWQPLANADVLTPATVTTAIRPITATLPPTTTPDRRNDNTAVTRDAAAMGQSAAKGQLRIVVHKGNAQQPIAGLWLHVVAGLPRDPMPANEPRVTDFMPGAFPARGHTDGAGTATFVVPPGRVTVRSSLLLPEEKPWQTEVFAGKESELTITLPIRVRTDIEVVDDEGRPLAGARILGRTIVDVGEVVERELGRTGSDGRWRDSFVESGLPLRAVLDGYAASRAVDVDANSGTVRLVLAATAATVEGTVFAVDGRPLPEAQVMIQPRSPGFAGARPLGLRTDANGRYRCDYVPAGPVTVIAASPVGVVERRCARSDAVAAVGLVTTTDVRFPTGTSLVVAIVGADGKPAVGQTVAAVLQPEAQLWIYLSAAAARNATTDAQGVATLADIMPGDYEVQAFTAQGTKRARLQLVAGSSERLHWTLGAASFVEVQLMDDVGRPLPDWVVTLTTDSGANREGRTAADGSVRFDDVPAQPCRLQARGRGSAIASVSTVAPTGQRTQLSVPASAMPEAAISGSVRPATGLDPESITAEIVPVDGERPEVRSDRGWQHQPLSADATFRFESLPAGTYLLGFRRGDREYLRMPHRVELTRGATIDLGAISLQLPTNLNIVVTATDDHAVTRPWLALATSEAPRDFGGAPQEAAGQTLSIKGIPGGSYELLVWGEDIVPTFVPLTVPTSMSPLPVVARRGTPTRFSLPGPAGSIRLWRDDSELLRVRLRSLATTLGLEPGNYRIEFESDGRRGTATFTVGTSPTNEITVPFK